MPAKYAKQERLKETVMDRLIERELLAAEAERLGYVVTDDEVVDQIGDAKIIGLGALHTVPRMQKDGRFNYEAFKSFVQLELGMTPKSFLEEQKKELLAARVRDLLRDGVTVSPDEVKAEFLRKQRQVNLEYMRFSGHRYESEVAPTDAEIADYAAKNEAKLREAYEQKKFLYEKVPAAAPGAADPGQGAQGRDPRGREGGAREGRQAGRAPQEGGQGGRQGRRDLRRARPRGVGGPGVEGEGGRPRLARARGDRPARGASRTRSGAPSRARSSGRSGATTASSS